MKKKFVFLIIYIIFFFNSNLLSENNNKILKVGLLAPLTGSYSELGNSLLYSLQLALEEINDKNVVVHRVLHKNTLKDFLYRSNLPLSEDKALSESKNFWKLIEEGEKAQKV